MKPVRELDFGFRDAENYKRRENRERFNRLFVPTKTQAQIFNPSTYFLIGEKGTGKTACAVHITNNYFANTVATLRYIRETEYEKFVSLKQAKQLTLTDYTNIWKVIISVNHGLG